MTKSKKANSPLKVQHVTGLIGQRGGFKVGFTRSLTPEGEKEVTGRLVYDHDGVTVRHHHVAPEDQINGVEVDTYCLFDGENELYFAVHNRSRGGRMMVTCYWSNDMDLGTNPDGSVSAWSMGAGDSTYYFFGPKSQAALKSIGLEFPGREYYREIGRSARARLSAEQQEHMSRFPVSDDDMTSFS
jgi:hypothetical protein